MFVTAIEVATGEGGEDIERQASRLCCHFFISDIRTCVCDKQAFHVESPIKRGHLLGYWILFLEGESTNDHNSCLNSYSTS